MEAEIHVENTKKTSNQQTRAHQKNTGEGNLRDHQRASNPGVALALARTAAAVLQRSVHGGRGNLEGRRQTKDHACEESDRQRETERVAVDPNAFEKRNEKVSRCATTRVPAIARIRPSTAPQPDSAILSVSI